MTRLTVWTKTCEECVIYASKNKVENNEPGQNSTVVEENSDCQKSNYNTNIHV